MAATYYVNLTNGSSTGLGTSASPLNYAQLVNYFDSSYGTAHGVVVDYDSTFYLSGNLDGLFSFSSGVNLFFNYALPSAGTFKFIGLDGPVVLFSSVSRTHFITCKIASLVVFANTNLEFDNVSVIVNTQNILSSMSVGWVGGGPCVCNNLKFKNCYIKNPFGGTIYLHQFAGQLDLFGCTLDGVIVVGGTGAIGNVTMYDCFLPGTITLSNISTLIAEGNASLSSVSVVLCSNILQYIAPVIVTQSTQLPTLDSFDGSAEYFSSKDNSLYTNYSIEQNGSVFRGVSPNIRIPNDFVYDAYGDPRDGAGMFAFGESDVIVGFGSIGAFYFGGDYTNSNIITWNPPVLEIMVENYAKDVSASFSIPEVVISVNQGVVPVINTRFSINFSATPITKGQLGSVVEIVDGSPSYSIYSVTGSSPFTVEFTAFGYPDGVVQTGENPQYVWKAMAFNWSFGDSSTSATSTPVIQHTYCGAHGTKFNVSLSADYELVEIG